jgi:hypothetical protein
MHVSIEVAGKLSNRTTSARSSKKINLPRKKSYRLLGVSCFYCRAEDLCKQLVNCLLTSHREFCRIRFRTFEFC